MKKETVFLQLIIKYWIPTFLWGVIIFSFSSVQTHPVSAIHWQDYIVKKSAHLVEYGIFTILLFRSYKASGLSSIKAFYLTLVTCYIYAITDETHQSFTPGREPTLRDILIDGLGSTVTLLILRDYATNMNKKFRNMLSKFGILY